MLVFPLDTEFSSFLHVKCVSCRYSFLISFWSCSFSFQVNLFVFEHLFQHICYIPYLSLFHCLLWHFKVWFLQCFFPFGHFFLMLFLLVCSDGYFVLFFRFLYLLLSVSVPSWFCSCSSSFLLCSWILMSHSSVSFSVVLSPCVTLSSSFCFSPLSSFTSFVLWLI